MANRFSIRQGGDFSEGLAGLSQSIARYGDIRRKEEEKEEMDQIKQGALEAFQSGDMERVYEYAAQHPEMAENLTKAYTFKNAYTKQNYINSIHQFLLDPDNAERIVKSRQAFLSTQGVEDTTTTDTFLERYKKDPEGTKKRLEGELKYLDPEKYEEWKEASGELDDAKKQKTASFLVRTPEGDIEQAVGSYNTKTGKLEMETAALPEGYEVVSKLGETGPEYSARQVKQKEDVTRVQTKEKRASDLIERGVMAAESTAVIRRAIDLLGTVKTGGFANLANKAKRLFGVEGGDEGELSNNLGKAVLSQLRETFGAAFTENEGKRLERIEANFGKSSATNKRLLSQALKIAENTARRARKEALARGDQATVDDIDDLLAFELGIPEDEEPTTTDKPKTDEELLQEAFPSN